MPVHSYFVLVAFSFFFVVFGFHYLRLRNSGTEFLGTPSIEKLYFYAGKYALFTTWALFIVKAINPRLGYIYLPSGFSWLAVGLLYFGIIIVSISLFNLGKSLTVGLPGKETTLQTHGLYRFSRNPIYAGVHLIAVASCIYFPDLLTVTFTIFGIYIHHRIIKEEERFLSVRFGEDWVRYSERVGRYL